jgi:hypothetical protein
MMHVRVSLVSADRRVLAGCLGYLEHGARPVLESRLAKIIGQNGRRLAKQAVIRTARSARTLSAIRP